MKKTLAEKRKERRERRKSLRKAQVSDGALEVSMIRKKLRHFTIEKDVEYWLKTKYKPLWAVLGHPTKGIPYGKIIQLAGKFSGGKTAVALELAAEAQADGASVVWVDLESSWDSDWARTRGLDPNKVAVIRPAVVKVKKDDLRMLSAEELYEEAETYIKMKRSKDPKCKIFMGVDSVAATLPAYDEEGGLEAGRRASLAAFMSKLLQRWTPLVSTNDVMMVMINQVRTSPMVRYGNPEYRPGGNTLDHDSGIIARVIRPPKKKRWILSSAKKRLGIRGVIVNQKNKVGGVEDIAVGFKVYFRKRAKFASTNESKED